MLDKAQIEEQLAEFAPFLNDGHLLALVDLRLPPKQQIPRIVAGHQAKGLIGDGHYHVQHVGENSSSAENLMDAQIEEQRKMNPDIKAPLSLHEQLEALKAENEALKAAQGGSAEASVDVPVDVAGFEALHPAKAASLIKKSVDDVALLEALEKSEKGGISKAATEKLEALKGAQ